MSSWPPCEILVDCICEFTSELLILFMDLCVCFYASAMLCCTVLIAVVVLKQFETGSAMSPLLFLLLKMGLAIGGFCGSD